MKDLKHYFTENSRNRDASEVAMKDEVTSDNASGEEPASEITNASKKRGRVKIKISKSLSRGKICDIVENNSDLVDKTPSPFAPRDLKNDDLPSDETPKKSKTRKSSKNRNSKNLSNIEETANGEIENSISDNNCTNGDSIARRDGRNVDEDENVQKSLVEMDVLRRAESNAFKVLMTRDKPPRYKPVAALTPREEEFAAKTAEDAKNRLKKNREKLTVLADKKGYAKRKLQETEEAERIEKSLGKRAKVFERTDRKESEDKNFTPPSRKPAVGSLHDYFGKTVSEEREKDFAVGSSMKMEVEARLLDSPDPPMFENIGKTSLLKNSSKSNDKKVQDLPAESDVAEALGSQASPIANGKSNIDRNCGKKARWSLRINLHCNDDDDQADPTMRKSESSGEEKRESKSRRAKEKTANYKDENESSDLAESRSSKQKKKKKKPAKTPIDNSILPDVENILEVSEAEIIEEKIVIKAGKLAPLFVKRQKPDPAVLEARRAFLQSVPTENNDRTNERKLSPAGSPILPFPSVSHVTQLAKGIKDNDRPSMFPERQIRPFVPNYDLKKFKEVTSLGATTRRSNVGKDSATKSSVEEALPDIEARCSDAREIWSRISPRLTERENERKKSPKQRGRRKKSLDKKAEDSTMGKNDGNCAWTEKYRPTCTRDIVGNEEAAEKFRKWLGGWRIDSEKGENSSGDEFYSSDCDYSRDSDNNRVAVLLGPHGCGKTASVYAIAQEMGYRVLEINASSKRAGKKILREIEEATKSHRIKRQDFTPLRTITSDNAKEMPENSLILIEDVDLVFEEDEGFISATCQLVSNTKRPIVMTGSKACSHLNRIAPRQIRMHFQNTHGSRVSALLELIAVAESGYRLPRPCLDRLLQSGDLRKALSQLQYLLISGKPEISAVPTNFRRSLWQDMRPCVYKPAIRGTRKLSKKKLANAEEEGEEKTISREKSIIDSLANDLDKLSFLTTIIEIEDPIIEMSSLKLEPSLSLDENTHDYSSARVTSLELAKWLRDRLINEAITHENIDFNNFRQLSLKKELNFGVNAALSQVSPNTLDRRSTMIDYLSAVRAICRIEEARSMNNNKRGNRFFHYLQNLRLPALSTRPNVLGAACKMLRDKDFES